MKNNRDSRGFLALFVVLIIFPIVWFVLDVNNIPSKIGIPVQFLPGQWSIILIGCYSSVLAALVGFIATAYSVKKTILFQSESRKEDNAIAALPLLRVEKEVEHSRPCDTTVKCLFDSISSKNKTYAPESFLGVNSAKLLLKNVGQREMYNVRAKCIKNGYFREIDNYKELVPIIYKDDSIVIGLDIYSSILKSHVARSGELISSSIDPTESIIISFIFDDCYGNSYEQQVRIDVTYYLYKVRTKYYKRFGSSKVKTCRVISAPKNIF